MKKINPQKGSILTKAIMIIALITVVGYGFSLLPSGDQYPLPETIEVGVTYIFEGMQAFDPIMPVDTFWDVLRMAVIILTISRILIPSVMKIIGWFASLAAAG